MLKAQDAADPVKAQRLLHAIRQKCPVPERASEVITKLAAEDTFKHRPGPVPDDLDAYYQSISEAKSRAEALLAKRERRAKDRADRLSENHPVFMLCLRRSCRNYGGEGSVCGH